MAVLAGDVPVSEAQWRAAYGLSPERDVSFTTLSGEPIEPLYTEQDLPDDCTASIVFAGIDLGAVSVSMTINAPAAIMLAYYVVAAEHQGVPPERLSGMIQADILKEYIAQKEWCFPIDPAVRLMIDMIEWCSRHMPRWHPVSISGYHIREAGSTAVQELAFTLKDGLTYVEQAVERGLDVDDFAPRLSFFFNAQIDFFEEIAKYASSSACQ